ncbi:alpha/beta hydrolase [Mycolicibacterium vanbaalenii]|uniref:alpha/beta hydrolase n=1 Tax=Mycolicibacterium vanbaalenii TaxID=110539 RepID=UPI001F29178F|nr:alpha/beta hydrolase [Mycolicibacterium vanbaalenii]
MSAIDAFYAVWTNARRTFGDGAPAGGAQFDASAKFRQLGTEVASATPDPVWSGGAAGAYRLKNYRHRAVFDRLADLDQRLGRSVDRSAQLVSTGRQNLESLRKWVSDAAASVPPGKFREVQLTQIASAGLARLQEIVLGTHTDLSVVAQDIVKLSTEYGSLTSEEGPSGDAREGEEKADEVVDGTDKTDMSSGDINRIDQANRDMLEDMRAEYQQLPDGQVKTDRLADIAAIEEALQTPGSRLVYLEKPDDPSRMIPAATSVGDPFTADHVSTTVPGVSGTTRGAIAGMTREAAELRNEAIDVAKSAGSPENPISTSVATVAWVGYQPPANLGQTSVLDDDLAQAGAPKLTSFLGELDAASRNPSQTTALFGHSYGSLTSGIALGDGASQYVDNAVLYGSPGFQAVTPADLGMTDDNFFVMATSDDPINYVADLAPLHGWGANPNDVIDNGDGTLRFRFEHLETDAGSTPIPGYESKAAASGHSDYGRNAGERMTGYNLAAILLDRPDLTVRETPLTW